ncbi:MAG: hypothetical protein WC837_04345 [Bellilinea sp.]
MEQQPVEMQIRLPEKREKRGSWIWGLIFIIGGVILLAQQVGWLGARYNWWALFILVPALASLGGGFSELQRSGRFGAAVRAGLGGGLILLTLSLMFLFGLDWSKWWPLMVLVAGLTIFLEGFGTEAPVGIGRILNIGLWIGLGAMFLGAGFLAKNLGIYDVSSVFNPLRWWAVAILIPGFGALLGGLASMLRGGKAAIGGFGLLLFGLMMLSVGLIALLGVSWRILTPTLLILAGFAILFGIFRKR